jgi:4-carboxymuconolactone decarboxylase
MISDNVTSVLDRPLHRGAPALTLTYQHIGRMAGRLQTGSTDRVAAARPGRYKKLYEDGLAVRRAVLGTEYVDRALANADAFTQPLQDFVTEYCWGGVWTRPGLPRKTRSLLNLAMLSTLGRTHELKLHVRGALNNGVSREEIAEVFLQVGVYAGVPAAVEAFRNAKEVFDEADKKK